MIAELFAAATDTEYLALDERQRIELLTAELHSARPLRSPWAKYSEATRAELEVLDEIARAVAPPRTTDRDPLRHLDGQVG